jgi:hypothetical protein
MQNVIEGFNKFRERIKPASLVELGERGEANSKLLGTYVVSKGHVLSTMTADQIADVLFQAVSDDSIITRLAWSVRPVKLLRYAENEKGINLPNARADQDAFAARAKKAEADKEKQAAQDAAMKRIHASIASFQLLDRMGTRIMYGKTEQAQQKAREFVKKRLAAGTDAVVIERAVRKYLADLYEEDERSKVTV